MITDHDPAAFIFPDGSIHYSRRGPTEFQGAITIDRFCRWESIEADRVRYIASPRRVCRVCVAQVRAALAARRQLSLRLGDPS